MAWISATISASSLSGAGLVVWLGQVCVWGGGGMEKKSEPPTSLSRVRRRRRPSAPLLVLPPSPSLPPLSPFPGHHLGVRLHVKGPPLQHVPLGAPGDHQHQPPEGARGEPPLEVLEHRREVRGELVVRGDREGEAVLLLLLEGLGRVNAALVQDATCEFFVFLFRFFCVEVEVEVEEEEEKGKMSGERERLSNDAFPFPLA